jgi:crotonobetainyl-CoA:carnitine CoA-transferase CaiB-like acyl-CoA transferase
MSGLPEPLPPAGIGYSYLDWFGAYNLALATLAALYRRHVTGSGCHIDASQAETGLYLTGTAVLDYAVNGRHWTRYGNRSPYKPAAPHGIYQVSGSDRWIAIAAFTETQWRSLVEVLGNGTWLEDARFETLELRLANSEALDVLVSSAVRLRDGQNLMMELQSRGIPAGVCQTMQDRYEADPQLQHLAWLTELDQSEIGRWPVRSHPTKMSGTPAYQGGIVDRAGPNYGEDTEHVLSHLLGKSMSEIDRLRADGVI